MTRKAIDVSVWQGKINWSKVKKDGVSAAIIRFADGNYHDGRFAENMKNAKAVGIHIGSYIFSRAKNSAQAEEEAQRLFNACKKYDPDMPLYIDMEWDGQKGNASIIAKAFLNEMKSLGGKGGIYANLNWFNNYITTEKFVEYPLWIAQYNKKLTAKHPQWFGMWQYSSNGKVDGINGNVDVNHLYIDYWNQKKTTIKKKITDAKKTTAVYYTVKKGDTLSEIAQKYNTTWKKLAELNHIKNANMINIGQKIKIK